MECRLVDTYPLLISSAHPSMTVLLGRTVSTTSDDSDAQQWTARGARVWQLRDDASTPPSGARTRARDVFIVKRVGANE